ncbi:death domain-containing protein CRADD [Salarias fasciatus]|uniref:Death domain-containing protein CRADD-like n=1 Tax=Salarias fasciatus TaxID=181472 RepID=A0A672FPC4_SALFA|nr:death domain-containing protein CRADD-like [Salarias fasciatus]
MDPAHRAVLRRLRVELSGQLLVSDAVLPLLFQEEVLTEAQVEDIESRSSERQKALRLLDLLPSRGPRAFPVFLRALDDFSWVRERLLEELREAGPGPGPGPGPGATEPRRPPEAVLRRVPSDRELSRLAARLGARWEELLLELGLTPEDVFRCRADHALSSQAAALAGLVRWRRAGGRGATVQRLQDGLQAVDLHPSVLEDILTADL